MKSKGDEKNVEIQEKVKQSLAKTEDVQTNNNYKNKVTFDNNR